MKPIACRICNETRGGKLDGHQFCETCHREGRLIPWKLKNIIIDGDLPEFDTERNDETGKRIWLCWVYTQGIIDFKTDKKKQFEAESFNELIDLVFKELGCE